MPRYENNQIMRGVFFIIYMNEPTTESWIMCLCACDLFIIFVILR